MASDEPKPIQAFHPAWRGIALGAAFGLATIVIGWIAGDQAGSAGVFNWEIAGLAAIAGAIVVLAATVGFLGWVFLGEIVARRDVSSGSGSGTDGAGKGRPRDAS
jgi:hypothetical protein